METEPEIPPPAEGGRGLSEAKGAGHSASALHVSTSSTGDGAKQTRLRRVSPPPRSARPLRVAEGEIVAIARTWIGTPYIHQASVKHAGCDCLGLLRGVWRELHGSEPQEIPPYSSDWAEASGEETLANALRLHLREIELAHMVPHPRSGGGGSSRSDETEGASAALMPGDIAVFRMLPHMPAKHCGIIGEQAETLTLIHARQNKRVSEEPFTQPWRRKLAYAFRL